MNESSQPLRSIDQTHQPTIHSPSFENTKMANILVRQQQMHRSPNISIHSSTSLPNDSKLSMTHSVDDRVFLRDSNQLIHLLKRFASEPHMSNSYLPTNHTLEQSNRSSDMFSLSSTPPLIPVTKTDNDELHFEDIFQLNCDKIQPVFDTLIDDTNSDDRIDDCITPVTTPTESHLDQVNDQQLNEDILLDTSPSPTTTTTTCSNELHCERHFRRRKRRSSLTKNSFTLDDSQSTVDLLNKLDLHSPQPSISLGVPENSQEKTEDVHSIEPKTSELDPSPEPVIDDPSSELVSRYRGRSKFIIVEKFFFISSTLEFPGLRHRFYRQVASVTTSPETNDNGTPDYQLPDEALNVEVPRMSSPRPSSPVTLSPASSSISPTLTITPNSNSDTSALKSLPTTKLPKKIVRFADSEGRELAQVQFIHSSNVDESKELSFLIGSSLLSSSPPSFSKNHLYLSNTSRLEHKPWSFDITLNNNQPSKDVAAIPRRFFCLYRQPNSEHADIYLHEIWKNQIKLEYADIPLKYSSTVEQELLGTLWVTNASYWKHVSVKYTFNRWLNTYECEAQHRAHSNDFRNLDQFEFAIIIPNDVDRIDFVLRYGVNGQEYWDNNDGKNYTLQTESAYTPSKPISLPHDCDFNEMRFY